MNNPKINWGIIGCGDVCEVKSGPAFYNLPNSSLQAVMRRSLLKAKDFAERHRANKYYDDADALINDENVTAIYIATPPNMHEEYLIKCLEKGKPVYVEKPVTISVASCKRMIDEKTKWQGKVTVAHYRRALPLFMEVKKIIHQNTLGKISAIKIKMLQQPANPLIAKTHENWRLNPAISGGGLFYDLAPHQLDILFWIFGKPIACTGSSKNIGNHYDAPDYTSLNVEFENNIHLNGVWNFSSEAEKEVDNCTIIGEKGSMEFAFFNSPNLYIKLDDKIDEFYLPAPKNIQTPMIEKVNNYFMNDAENPCSLEEALVVMEMMEATRPL